MFDDKRPRIHSIGVHGIECVVIERDTKYNELSIRLKTGKYGEFTVTVHTDNNDLPPVSIVDVTHNLEDQQNAQATA